MGVHIGLRAKQNIPYFCPGIVFFKRFSSDWDPLQDLFDAAATSPLSFILFFLSRQLQLVLKSQTAALPVPSLHLCFKEKDAPVRHPVPHRQSVMFKAAQKLFFNEIICLFFPKAKQLFYVLALIFVSN